MKKYYFVGVMKLNDFYKNLKHTGRVCPFCKNSESVLFDTFHGETFCAKCGLVLQNSTRKSVVELSKRKLKRKKRGK